MFVRTETHEHACHWPLTSIPQTLAVTRWRIRQHMGIHIGLDILCSACSPSAADVNVKKSVVTTSGAFMMVCRGRRVWEVVKERGVWEHGRTFIDMLSRLGARVL